MADAIRIDKYTLLKLEDTGKYGWRIIEGWENRVGEFKPNFCKRTFGKDGEEKLVPVQIKLGDKEQAVNTLFALLKMLDAEQIADLGDDDIPI